MKLSVLFIALISLTKALASAIEPLPLELLEEEELLDVDELLLDVDELLLELDVEEDEELLELEDELEELELLELESGFPGQAAPGHQLLPAFTVWVM